MPALIKFSDILPIKGFLSILDKSDLGKRHATGQPYLSPSEANLHASVYPKAKQNEAGAHAQMGQDDDSYFFEDLGIPVYLVPEHANMVDIEADEPENKSGFFDFM